jgi:quercetin dioxygenase-like cupin family protein
MKRLAVLGAIIALALSAATAYATPGIGVTATVLGRGPNQVTDSLNHTGGLEVVTQTITFPPGSTTGWHTHPGEVVVVVAQGTLSLWRSPGTAEQANCTKRDITAGQSWVAPGSGTEFDLARNETTETVIVHVTYVNVPVGATSFLTHVGPPNPCPGTPDEFASAGGITGAVLGRATMPAFNIAVPSGPEFVIQQVTIAPGGEAGWHSHPGHSMVLVTGGDATFVHNDCTTTTIPAGTGFVDAPNVVHNLRNPGTTPIVVFPTYTNVPAGGAFRNDAAAPACAAPAPAPATATAAPLPNTAAADSAWVAPTTAMPVLLLAILGASGAALAVAYKRRSR